MPLDRNRDVEQWLSLLEPAASELIAALAAIDKLDAPSPALITKLRRIGPAELVAPAIELVCARRRAARKLPDTERLLVDREGVEQASSWACATHKARRFADVEPAHILDLCCGIGADAMALRTVDPELVGIDHDPLRAAMTAHNAGCQTRCLDVADIQPEAAIHLDPSRRLEGGGGHRLFDLADYQPGPEVIEAWLAGGRDAAVKLGPGVDLSAIPSPELREIEVLGEAAGLAQTVLWCGALAQAPGQRSATRVDTGLSFTGRPSRVTTVATTTGRYLLLPQAALERCELVAARLAAINASDTVSDLAPGLGVLTSDAAVDDPWFRRYTVEITLPWRPKRLRAWLRAHDAGLVTVKTRGGAVDAIAAQRQLRGDGHRPFVLFGLRLGLKIVAVITRASD